MQTYEGIWRKRQFVPSWIIQCIISAFFVVAACLIFWAVTHWRRALYSDLGESSWTKIRGLLIGEAVYLLVLSLFTIGANVAEAVLFRRRRLSPVTVLALAVIRTAGWLVYLLVVAIGAASIVDIILGVIMVVTSLVQLFLGAQFTHRKRNGLLAHRVAKEGHVEHGINNYNNNNTNTTTTGY